MARATPPQRWCVPRWPFASIYSLMAVAKRMEGLTAREVSPLQRQFPPTKKWEHWSRWYSPLSALRFGLSVPSLKLACELPLWCPQALRAWGAALPPMPLRFCVECARRGYHMPGFQFRWWRRCPLHDRALREACPSCDQPLPSMFTAGQLCRLFRCGACGHDLMSPAAFTQLEPAPTGTRQRLTECALAYLTWVRDVDVRFAGDGQFEGPPAGADAIWSYALRRASPGLIRGGALQRCLGGKTLAPAGVAHASFTSRASRRHRAQEFVWRVHSERDADAVSAQPWYGLPAKWGPLLTRKWADALQEHGVRLEGTRPGRPLAGQELIAVSLTGGKEIPRACLRLLRYMDERFVAGLRCQTSLPGAVGVDCPVGARWFLPGRLQDQPTLWRASRWLNEQRMARAWCDVLLHADQAASAHSLALVTPRAWCVVWVPIGQGRRYTAVLGSYPSPPPCANG